VVGGKGPDGLHAVGIENRRFDLGRGGPWGGR